jgi:hypothetical protein
LNLIESGLKLLASFCLLDGKHFFNRPDSMCVLIGRSKLANLTGYIWIYGSAMEAPHDRNGQGMPLIDQTIGGIGRFLRNNPRQPQPFFYDEEGFTGYAVDSMLPVRMDFDRRFSVR